MTLQEVDRLTRIPGIGKKTAERLLLELKGKIGADLGVSQDASAPKSASSEVLQALLALGYSDKEASMATKQVPIDASVSDGIRIALKALSKA